MKDFISLRLAAQTKTMIEKLIIERQKQLLELNQDAVIDTIECVAYNKFKDELNGVSLSISFNVTIGSIIEQIYDQTKDLSLEKWDEYAKALKTKENKEIAKQVNKTLISKLTISRTVMDGIKKYSLEFMSLPTYSEAKRAINLGYVIKLMIFAYVKINKINI